MKRALILPALALLGAGIAIVTVIHSSKPARVSAPAITTYQPPYATYVAGTGIVEATTGNIAIGTPVSGVVMAIDVKVGDQVKAGDPLFRIDDRDLQAQLLTANARVREAAAALQLPQHRLASAEHFKQHDPKAISAQDLSDLRDETAQAEAALGLAKAQVEQLQMEIQRHIVRAPVAGEILQLKMRLGEYVEGTSMAPPLLVLGGNNRLFLRVNVDEQDAWRVRPGADAVAVVRSHPTPSIPLRYEYTEPLMVPKTSLTGQSTERTDTRVLQVLYSFAPARLPVYVGQQLDVFIKSPAGVASNTGP